MIAPLLNNKYKEIGFYGILYTEKLKIRNFVSFKNPVELYVECWIYAEWPQYERIILNSQADKFYGDCKLQPRSEL